MNYKTPLWDWNIAYAFDYRYYAKKTKGDDKTHNLNARTHIEITDEFFFDVKDEYKRVSLDITKDYTRESLFLYQTDRNTIILNPYLVLRPASMVNMTVGYRYLNTWYEEETAINKTDNIAYTELKTELSQRLILDIDFEYANEINDITEYDKSDLYIGSRYEYAENSHIFFKAGNSWLNFKGREGYTNLLWDAGITHKFHTLTSSLEGSIKYNENPLGNPLLESMYSASIKKEFTRTSLGISGSLNEYTDTTTNILQSKRYGIRGDIMHEITQKMTGSIDFSSERFDFEYPKGDTIRYLTGLKINYMPLSNLTATLAYNYTDYYSPSIAIDNYKNNRFIAEIKKMF